MADEISRREFVKQTVAGTAMLAGASAGALEAAAAAPMDPNKQIVAALGSVFIPSKPGDPGYKELESHGITEYVMEKLPGRGFARCIQHCRQAILRWKEPFWIWTRSSGSNIWR